MWGDAGTPKELQAKPTWTQDTTKGQHRDCPVHYMLRCRLMFICRKGAVGKEPVLPVALQQRDQGIADLHPLGFPRRAFIPLELLALRPKSLCQLGLLHTLQAMYQYSLRFQIFWHCLLHGRTVSEEDALSSLQQ